MNTLNSNDERYIALRDLTINTLGPDPSVITSDIDSPNRCSELAELWYSYSSNKYLCQRIIPSAFHYIKYGDCHKKVNDQLKPLIEMIADNLIHNNELKEAVCNHRHYKFDVFSCTHCIYNRKHPLFKSKAHNQYMNSYLKWKIGSPKEEHALADQQYVYTFQRIITDMLPEAKNWTHSQWSDINLITHKFRFTYKAGSFTPVDLECMMLIQIPFVLLNYTPDLDELTPSKQFYDMLCSIGNDEKVIRRATANFLALVDTSRKKANGQAELQECYQKIRNSFYFKLCNYRLANNRLPGDLISPVKSTIFSAAVC